METPRTDRYQRRVQKWTREAQLPNGKTFNSLTISRFSPTNQGKLAKLQQDIGWAHSAENVLLLGPSGTGKTHIAGALGYALIEKGIRCNMALCQWKINTVAFQCKI